MVKRLCRLTFMVLSCLALLISCRRPLPGTAPPFVEAGGPGTSAAVSWEEEPPSRPDSSAPPLEEDPAAGPADPVPPASQLADSSVSPPQGSEPPQALPPAVPPEAGEPEAQPPAVPPETGEPEPEAPAPAKTNTRLYVLMYHHFVPEGQTCNQWMLTDVRFREDLQWLTDHGWTTVLPSELTAGTGLPEKAVMLTFDDGYRSNYEIAYPLLREFDAKAALSIVTQYTADQYPDCLTWDMCREMVQSGLVEIGSHTNSCHGDRGIERRKGEDRETYRARVQPDIQTSIDLIEQNVGTRPIFFAYPNGIKDRWAADYIADHFPITLVTVGGCSDLKNGLYSLRRYNVSMEVPLSEVLPG